MKTLFATRLASAGLWLVLASGAVLADPPQDKGNSPGNSPGKSAAQNANPNASQGASQGSSKGKPPVYSNDAGRYDDQRRDGKDASNRGQVVSNCNHRANERDIRGQARKQWVEWCIDRGERYSYDDTRWHANRDCYRLADNRGLSGDARRRYLHDCLARADSKYDTSRDPTRGEPRGRDALGKGSDR